MWGWHYARDDGEALPRMAVMPREQLSIEPTWNVIGMVGTGSHDLVVDDLLVVPEEWTFTRGGKPNLDDPFFSYPSLAFASAGFIGNNAGSGP